MRVLTSSELLAVGGGGDIADAAQAGAAFGGAIGIGYGMASGGTGSAVVGMGTIGAMAMAGVFAAGAAGYAVGSWANSTFSISDRLLDMMSN